MNRPPLKKQLSKISEKSADIDCVLNIDNSVSEAVLERLGSFPSSDSEDDPEVAVALPFTRHDLMPLPGRRRNLSLCEFTEVNNYLRGFSLPNLLRKDSSKTSLSSNESGKFEALPPHWKEIFDSLDGKDGRKDGKIHKQSLQNILGILETNSILSLEVVETGTNKHRIQRQISKADANKDGFIDREEFSDWVGAMEEAAEEEDTRSLHDVTKKHMETAAYAVECRTWPPPLFLALVSAAQLAMFCYHVHHLAAAHGLAMFWTGPAPLCSPWILHPEKRGQAWRFLSYALVHSGIGHIVLNLLVQLVVGLPLEMAHGCGRVAAVYLVGVAAGSLATSCLNPYVYLAGASSGVYALIAAHLASLVLNWHEERLIINTGCSLATSPATATHGGLIRLLKLTAILAYVSVDIAMAAYSHTVYGEQNTTGYTAHLAGAGLGFAAGLLVLHNTRVERWEVRLRLGCGLLLASCLLGSLAWQLLGASLHPGYFPAQTPGLGHDNTTRVHWVH